jgi:hypothetical protein
MNEVNADLKGVSEILLNMKDKINTTTKKLHLFISFLKNISANFQNWNIFFLKMLVPDENVILNIFFA